MRNLIMILMIFLIGLLSFFLYGSKKTIKKHKVEIMELNKNYQLEVEKLKYNCRIKEENCQIETQILEEEYLEKDSDLNACLGALESDCCPIKINKNK